MRKAKWAAAAAGVVLLVAGCGSEGGSGKGGATGAPSQGASAPAEENGGGSLDAAAVKKEIADAATAAGFTEKPGDDVPPTLKDCMVSWSPETKQAADPKKSYEDTVAALTKGGWNQGQKFEQGPSTINSLDKSGWTVKANYSGAPVGTKQTFVIVHFVATDNGAACEALFKADLEKNKKS
ncbi:hypothetical protein ACH44C_04790 [Streptomyces purpureus]|uniref:hypothetical protein n=1 Tax=Streptomyces purpureus TaxID=1951 RepID=UPI00036CEE56|nr:hypothetical protein [Streptomyces purpureus]